MKEIIFLGLGAAFLIVYGSLIIVKKANCKKEIQATFVKHIITYSKYSKNYTPVFVYEYNGAVYESKTIEYYKRRKAGEFIEGERYRVLINENNPKHICVSTKVRFTDIIVVLLGVLMAFCCVMEFLTR